MPLKTEKVVYLHGRRTAEALRALAELAESGKHVGVAVAARTPEGDVDMRIIGIYERSPALAYRDVARLLDSLLYVGDGI